MTWSVADIFAPDGPIAANLPGYEQRDEQVEMAAAVESAFADNEHLIAEAGTGVGKSFAYLVPAVLRAAQENQRVVISTYTIALQEQLIGKDLPFLSEVMPVEFSAVLGKGRGNYLCLRRLSLAVKNRDRLFASEREMESLERVAGWAMETETGSLQEIDFGVDPRVWARVRSESGTCQGSRCANFGRCFLQAARRRMHDADVLVVNHALFFANLALEEGAGDLLGPYDLAVLDEAHTVEQVAGDHFGGSVSSSNVEYLLRELYDDRNDRGLLALMGDTDAISTVNHARNVSEAFFDALADAGGADVSSSGRITRPGIVSNDLSPALASVAKLARRLRSRCKDDDQRSELYACEMRATELGGQVESLITQQADEHAYWLNVRRRRGGATVTLASAPINVAPILQRTVFDGVNSAVLTSATLATSRGGKRGFEYIRSRLGMAEGRELLLTSPFDFRRKARLYAETRLGDPNDLDTFVPAACEAIEYYVAKSQGRAFVLFTSYAMLQRVAERLEDFCDRSGFNLLAQGGSLQRSTMLKRFREGRGVLLGTMSFWQGVDVAGEALSNVIITKLPFAAPNDPIVEARIDTIRDRGGNPFGDYQLPEAIIRFKQGFGRLIRSQSDTGIIVVLDHRLITRSYGKQFVASLPDIGIVRDEFCNSGQLF